MKQIEVTFDGGKKTAVPFGSEVAAALRALAEVDPSASVAASGRTCAGAYVNNKSLPLSAPLYTDADIRAMPIESKDGIQAYRHTLAYLMIKASKKVLDDKEIYMGHSLGHAYFYAVTRGVKLTESEIAAMKKELQRLIAADLPITYTLLNFKEALQYFTEVGQKETVALLTLRSRWEIPVNKCEDFMDTYSRPLLDRTSLIQAFDLCPYNDGFLLMFPNSTDITKLSAFEDNPKIFSVYREYKKWGHIVNLFAVPQLNLLIKNRTIKEFIRINEAYQNKKLGSIAEQVLAKKDKIKLVLIAGPSSSGKTTTAKRLSIQLRMLGINPIAVSLDDYYRHPDLAPKDENGKPDLECLESLDVSYLNKQILSLLAGEEVTLPTYDFKTCTRKDGAKIRLTKNDVLLLEGIHGLNDALTPQIETEKKFKIYVSALTQMNIDEHTRVSTTDNRLLRRLVRDYQFRGSPAEKTLSMWEAVQRGAEKHIFRFQNGADAVFNSALDYEISVLRFYAEPLLRGVPPTCSEFAQAQRILDFLENFSGIPPQYVPTQSILREFIGESEFKY
ncbi:MAG: nucleoside kinase [Termitinemataceae bacterium]|nr:MAG: nucleoside kinase [Termitinemataceae bacterium]